MNHIEEMESDGEKRFAYERGSPEFDTALAGLQEQFGSMDSALWRSISTPQYSSIYDDNIVSVVFRAIPFHLEGLKPSAAGRKFFLNKGWVYDKVYVHTYPAICDLPVPETGTPMFIGYLVNVFKQPGDANLSQYKCLYFMALDHSKVEEWAGQNLIQGKYSTFYAATFDTADNNKLLRMKSYAYDDQGSFSDWEVIWLTTNKARNIEV